MFTIDNNFSWKVREKRAKEMLTSLLCVLNPLISRPVSSLLDISLVRDRYTKRERNETNKKVTK